MVNTVKEITTASSKNHIKTINAFSGQMQSYRSSQHVAYKNILFASLGDKDNITRDTEK